MNIIQFVLNLLLGNHGGALPSCYDCDDSPVINNAGNGGIGDYGKMYYGN